MNNFLNILNGFLAPDPESFLFKDEKINTVIVVLVAVWAVIAGYMFFTGRKISKLEQELDRMKSQQADRGEKEEKRIEIQNNRS